MPGGKKRADRRDAYLTALREMYTYRNDRRELSRAVKAFDLKTYEAKAHKINVDAIVERQASVVAFAPDAVMNALATYYDLTDRLHAELLRASHHPRDGPLTT